MFLAPGPRGGRVWVGGWVGEVIGRILYRRPFKFLDSYTPILTKELTIPSYVLSSKMTKGCLLVKHVRTFTCTILYVLFYKHYVELRIVLNILSSFKPFWCVGYLKLMSTWSEIWCSDQRTSWPVSPGYGKAGSSLKAFMAPKTYLYSW
jgi:hypothetical protein